MATSARTGGRVDFKRVAQAALQRAPALLPVLLPNGKFAGGEYVALNPFRADRSLGSFKVNVRSGRWADFATGDRGGDLIALVAWQTRKTQREAALHLAEILGISPWA